MNTKAKTKKALVRGDRVQIKDRLYAVITKRGRVMVNAYGNMAIYAARKDALWDMSAVFGERVIRLDDISGTVV